MAPRLSLRQLQIFRSVAETGSTAAAAQAINLSQSAASAAIKELERLLNLQLFDRVGKRLLLNDNGRTLLAPALATLDSASWIERWGNEVQFQPTVLQVGASTTIGNYLLPAIVAEYRQHLPAAARDQLQLRVTIANTAEIAAKVAAFELDLGLIEGPCHESSLAAQPWIEDELVVVAAAQDPIVANRRRRIPLAELRKANWLLREAGSGTREVLNSLLIPHLHQLRSSMEFGNSEAIKRATACGLGITCLSHCVVSDFLASGLLVAPSTELPRLKRQFYLIRHEARQCTRALDALIACLHDVARRQAGSVAPRPRARRQRSPA